MLCTEFEDRITDYLDGVLESESHSAFAAHALRCPVCHSTLTEVRNTLQACRMASVPPPPRDLEAAILRETTPELAMNCEDFEESLTDYLDGFLPAPLYHRWERHAALCTRCTELPGEVVRSIGACYTYVAEEMPIPVGLNARILQATIGTMKAEELQAPLTSRVASWLRGLLDPIVSPQLATVATMLLVAVFVLTNTVSTDGSIGGVYAASLRLAEQSTSSKSKSGIKELTDGLKGLIGGEPGEKKPAASNTPGNANQVQPSESPVGTKTGSNGNTSKSSEK